MGRWPDAAGVEESLDAREMELIDASLAKGTRIRYQKEWNWFQQFRPTGLSGEEKVRKYITWMERIGRGGSVPTALAAISRKSVELGLPDWTRNGRIKILADGIAREVAKKKIPLERDPLPVAAVHQYLLNEQNSACKRRDAALVALGIRGMRRANELCNLRMEDVTFREGMMMVKIRRQKNDQLGRGLTLFIERTHSASCPVMLMEEYLKLRGEDHGWLFLSVDGRQLSTAAVSSIVKRVADVAGVKGRFSSHSMRIGGATAAMEGGMTKEQIKAIGGWSGEAVERYMRAREVAQLKASTLMGF